MARQREEALPDSSLKKILAQQNYFIKPDKDGQTTNFTISGISKRFMMFDVKLINDAYDL